MAYIRGFTVLYEAVRIRATALANDPSLSASAHQHINFGCTMSLKQPSKLPKQDGNCL